MAKANNRRKSTGRPIIGGTHAVLGMDIVSFSLLHDDDQLQAIETFLRWVNEALAYHSVGEAEYRWSPAGDGGYLTFATSSACRRAIDVGFSIIQKTEHPDWRPRNGEKLRLRLALHSGTVQEACELGGHINIWGMGINMAARVLSVSSPSQLLVSKEYFDLYIKGQRELEFTFGELHFRTVKHDKHVEVMNASRNELGLRQDEAKDRRWQSIGGLWQKTIKEYRSLISDTMRSGEPMAALAAAKFLLELGEQGPVHELCQMISSLDRRPKTGYPAQLHFLFSLMPPDVLFRVIEIAVPRMVKAGSVVCKQGDPADSCFLGVSGSLVVDVPGQDKPIRIAPGDIIGEFSLWIPNISRTATIRATDESLLLAFHKDLFAEVLSHAPAVAEAIHNVIKTRILENVLKSRKYFPLDQSALRDGPTGIAASCEKYAKGTVLDLASSAFIVFSGRVRIAPPDGSELELTTTGGIGAEQVAGIVCEIGAPDGTTARVIEDTVAVKISTRSLLELQRSEPVGIAWSALYGERLRAIRKSQLRQAAMQAESKTGAADEADTIR